MAGAALGEQARRTAGLVHGVEQIAAVDAEIVQTVRVELEKIAKGQSLRAGGAAFGEPSRNERQGIELK